MKTIEIIISGKVQGVWYRKSSREKALNLGLKGWVCNLENGAVLARVSGSQEKLDDFVNWCKIGPPFAVVQKVEVKESKFEQFQDFEIKRN